MAKLSHSGITAYKKFDGFKRHVSDKSKNNLLGVLRKSGIDEIQKITDKGRILNDKQSRRLRSDCNKLAYYSANRSFTSRKSGKKYKMKVAFLTLTAPALATTEQINKAFEGFLDYLRRTANCVYVWKKELGERNNKLHFHLLINNFIPYYIVSWKWKRLLIAQGVHWPLNAAGKHTDSHYRIELPRNGKQVSHYISKYLSKAYELPRNLGYVAGRSQVLVDCKELHLFPDEYDYDEINTLKSMSYYIEYDHFSHICCDLKMFKGMCPWLYSVFMGQVSNFSEKLSLPQKFHFT